MIALRFISIFTVLNVVVLARPGIVEMDEGPRVINYHSLYKDTLKFQCKPQPRAFLAKDLLTEPLEAAEKLKPNNVILHRCDQQSGCCLMDNEVCGEHTSEVVIIELRAENIFTGTTRNINITDINHTSCKCALDSAPKRISDTNDARVESLTSAGLTINPYEHKLLSVASLFYVIYLSYSFCF